MKYIALRTEDGEKKGKIAFYCSVLGVSRQGFYQYLANRDRPWKYQVLADAMLEIVAEDACNDTYGRTRMRQALELKAPEGIAIPCERTVYRVMERLGLSHRPSASQRDHQGRPGGDEVRRSAETGLFRTEAFGKMRHGYHRGQGKGRKIVCIRHL